MDKVEEEEEAILPIVAVAPSANVETRPGTEVLRDLLSDSSCVRRLRLEDFASESENLNRAFVPSRIGRPDFSVSLMDAM